jgi:hypothetical protein
MLFVLRRTRIWGRESARGTWKDGEDRSKVKAVLVGAVKIHLGVETRLHLLLISSLGKVISWLPTNFVYWVKASSIRCIEWAPKTEFFCLLGYYAAWGGLKPTFRDNLPVLLSRIKISELLLGHLSLNILILDDGPDRLFRNVSFKPCHAT